MGKFVKKPTNKIDKSVKMHSTAIVKTKQTVSQKTKAKIKQLVKNTEHKNHIKSKKRNSAPLKHTTEKEDHEFNPKTIENETSNDIDNTSKYVLPNIDDDDQLSDASNTSIDHEDDVHNHQAALDRLKDTDPEFYKFLQENDRRLLNFNVSDSEEEKDSEQDVHIPSTHLEVASDESDFEEDVQNTEHSSATIKVTLQLITKWQQQLQTDCKSNTAILAAISAFNAALATVAPSEDGPTSSAYKIEGAAVFNATIQLCILHLSPAVRRFLQLRPKQAPHTAKRFPKVRTALRSYFTDLQHLLASVAHSGNIIVVLLKHLLHMSPLLVSFQSVARALIARSCHLWGSSSSESVRVLAFLVIVRLVNGQRDAHLERTLKMMYLTYVRNAKFVSAQTLPAINFMRRSLVEVFAMDMRIAYRHVFLYVRQLAIHLRNALCARTREHVQIVYNWQYVNSLRLWAALLSQTDHPQLKALIYPFVQVCLGCIKLQPTAAYIPLRFHVCQLLTEMAHATGVYVPVMPFLVEPLALFDALNRKHAKLSMKPLSLECALRVGKAQMAESGFKDAIVDGVYAGLLEYAASHSASIAFPDLMAMPKMQIKRFVKKCQVKKYTQKMAQLLEKFEENAAFIEQERAKFAHSLTDGKQIEGWETQVRMAGTPLALFFSNWEKVRKLKKAKHATDNEAIGEYNLPVVVRKKRVVNGAAKGDGKVELFPSDSEDEEVSPKQANKRGRRGGKKHKRELTQGAAGHDEVVGNGDRDVVEDITDW